MKFFDCKTAPSPRRVRIFAAEKGLQLDTVQVDLAAGEQFGDAYRAVNPDCVVPALKLDDGTVITEVAAICQYLEELHPEPGLLGDTPVQRALVSMWNIKSEQQGLWACAEALRNSAPGLKGRAIPGADKFEQIPELAERGRARIALFQAKLDRRLADVEFLAGSDYSMADITAMVVMDFANRLKLPIPDDHANLIRWYQLVSSRPSAKA